MGRGCVYKRGMEPIDRASDRGHDAGGPTGVGSPSAPFDRPALRSALVLVPLVLLAVTSTFLHAAPASAAPAPWWQVLSGSRPSNLGQSADASEVQEVRGEKLLEAVFAAEVEVGGDVVGCLGTGALGLSANQLCVSETGFGAAATAAELEAMLEGPYGAGQVEVSGGPIADAPLLIITPGRWVTPVVITPLTPAIFSGVAAGTASTAFKSEGSGRLFLTMTNLGTAPVDGSETPLTIVDELPAGISAYGVEAVAGIGGEGDPIDCQIETTSHLACVFEGKLAPYETIEVQVLVAADPSATTSGQITVSGANAPTASAAQVVHVSDDAAPFGLEHFSMRAEEEGGVPTEQAGAHPFQMATAITLRQTADAQPLAAPKDLKIKLPPGLLAGAAGLASCPFEQLFVAACPLTSVVGVAALTVNEPDALGITTLAYPVFNVEPASGEPARFGFVAGELPVLIDTSLAAADRYGATLRVGNISEAAAFLSATIVLWGVPADPRHDAARGLGCLWEASGKEGYICESLSHRQQLALLSLPTSCAGPLRSSVEVASWIHPLDLISSSSILPALTGCNRLSSTPAPDLTVEPTSLAPSAPTGLDIQLQLSDEGLLNPGGLAEPLLTKVELMLPDGMTINPPGAAGLGACTPADLARETLKSDPGTGCPDAARVGSVEASTPLLDRPVAGQLFVAQPDDQATTDHRFVVYLILRDRARGILVKHAISVRPDTASGRLKTSAEAIPELPLSRLRLRFNTGPHAPLTTPASCGSHTIAYELTPSSGNAPLSGFDTFTTTGLDCTPTFAPSLSAGTASNAAGRSAPFLLDLQTPQGSPNLSLPQAHPATRPLRRPRRCGDLSRGRHSDRRLPTGLAPRLRPHRPRLRP